MSVESILAEIDAEIEKLRQVRSLLSKSGSIDALIAKPKGRKATAKKAAKRVLSPEARARIAAAQKRRWAAAKKSSKKAA